jgi:AcrR family transcriptional regulator
VSPPRAPLTRERILRAAIDVADRHGLAALTMRRLGATLGVEAMALYKHVDGKDAILDGIVELIVGEIEVPDDRDWRSAMRRRATSARAVLGRHPWAIGLLETRSATGPAALRYLDRTLGSLRAAGFPIEDAGHAFWLLDSFVYGHVLQEANARFRSSQDMARSDAWEALAPEAYPNLAEIVHDASRSEYTIDREFAFGLELILDALARRLEEHGRSGAAGMLR